MVSNPSIIPSVHVDCAWCHGCMTHPFGCKPVGYPSHPQMSPLGDQSISTSWRGHPVRRSTPTLFELTKNQLHSCVPDPRFVSTGAVFRYVSAVRKGKLGRLQAQFPPRVENRFLFGRSWSQQSRSTCQNIDILRSFSATSTRLGSNQGSPR